jgi:uncharacterized protein YecA (UPF0149 family)
MMDSELREYIGKSALDKQLIRHVQSLLPADDAELDRWLADSLPRQAYNEFVSVICAALLEGRHVDPRHLAQGGLILAAAGILPEVVMRMRQEDLPEYLLQSVDVNIPRRHKALILVVIAVWCRLHRNSVFPPRLLEFAREMARQPDEDHSIPDWLAGVALIAGDQGLAALIRKSNPYLAPEAEWKKALAAVSTFEQRLAGIPGKPILDVFGEQGERIVAFGSTMRRSVARTGRNEPCPCGSGKKYKRCCFDKDQERLRHSTSFAGVTDEEFDAAPEAHLTADSFEHLPWERIERIDPTKLPPGFLEPYFAALTRMGVLDRLVDSFETIGYSEALHPTWRTAAALVVTRHRKDLAERLVKIRRSAGFPDDDLDDVIRFCLIEDDSTAWMSFLEERMDSALVDEDPNALWHLAQAAAYSKYPALGVFVCRSVAPLLSPKEASSVLEDLSKARDRLNLLPEDPITDVVDKVWAKENDETGQSEAVQETLQALEAKRREARELKEVIQRFERDLKRAQAAPAQGAGTAAPAAGENEVTRALRRKIGMLTHNLKEVHNERNAFRRKYGEAQEHIGELNQQTPTAPDRSRADMKESAEDELLLPHDSPTAHPVRLIGFPRDFDQRLRDVPRMVARATMTMLGRLAAGEPAAFVGAVRLKACPTVTRQRIGMDWRLLFRLLQDRIEVVDLIPRQDLERKIRTLSS